MYFPLQNEMHLVWLYYRLCERYFCGRNLVWYSRKTEWGYSRYSAIYRLVSKTWLCCYSSLYGRNLVGYSGKTEGRYSRYIATLRWLSKARFFLVSFVPSTFGFPQQTSALPSAWRKKKSFNSAAFSSLSSDRDTFRRTTDANSLKVLGANRPLLQVSFAVFILLQKQK